MRTDWKQLVLCASLAVGLCFSCHDAVANDADELSKLLGEPSDAPAPAADAPPDQAANPGTPESSSPPQESQPAGDQSAAAASNVDLPVIELPKKEGKPIPPPERTKAKGVIDEIIVNAQRREENLQDVPISMTVFSQEQLNNANITSSTDLARYTPSLSANSRFGSDNASFTIRGFTQDLRTTASVGTYFAEVIAPRGQSTQTSGDGAGPGSLFDLQSVQVLKGPQGTLFGRNTTGGAILLVPQKPTDNFEGYVEATGGDYGAMRGQVVLNVPLSESLKFRLGIDANRRDGYITNVIDIGAKMMADTNYNAGRLSAVWNITDKIENYTILSMTNSLNHGSTSQLYACNDLLKNVQNPSQINVQELIQGLVTTIQTQKVNLTDPLPGLLTGSPFALLTFQACQQQLADQKAAGKDGFYDVESSVKTPITQIKERRLINTTTWQALENVTLKNIFAYAHLYTLNGSNIFGNFFPDPTDLTGKREFGIGHTIKRKHMPVTSQQTFVEEVQAQGTALDSALNWQAGLYFENSRPDGFSGNNTAALIYCDVATLEGDPSGFNCNDPFQGILGGALLYKVKTWYLNKAAYAQGTYNFLDHFGVTLGLRYTEDDTKGVGVKDLYRYNLTVQEADAQTVQKPRVSSTAPTGMLEFDYRPTDEIMTYAKYTRGYRQGTVNMLADPGLDTHKPEYVKTYELGFKSNFEWPIPGRFNIALFSNVLTDMQLQGGYISSTSGPTTAIFNAGEGRSRGLEIESTFQPFDFLVANLSYSYLDTELVKSADFCSRVNNVGFLAGFSCTPIAEVGDQLPFAPKSSYVGTLNWILPIPEDYGQVNVGMTYAYTGKQRVAASNSTPFAMLDGFGILNLNASWTHIWNHPYDINLFATNLTNKQYVVFTTGTYRPLGIESRNQGQPRMIGARLKVNF